MAGSEQDFSEDDLDDKQGLLDTDSYAGAGSDGRDKSASTQPA